MPGPWIFRGGFVPVRRSGLSLPECLGGGERTRTADFYVAKMDRRNPVNRTYANSPLLACGSTRQHAAARGISDAPVRARDAPAKEGQSIRANTPDRLAAEMPLLIRLIEEST